MINRTFDPIYRYYSFLIAVIRKNALEMGSLQILLIMLLTIQVYLGSVDAKKISGISFLVISLLI